MNQTDNVTTLPVSAAELTQTEINASIKIGRRVIKEQLKEKIEVIRTIAEPLREKANNILTADELYGELQHQFEKEINSDSDFTKLRRAINTFSGSGIRSNLHLVIDNDITEIVDGITHPFSWRNSGKNFKYHENMEILVSFSTHFALRDQKDFGGACADDAIENNYTRKFTIPNKFLLALTEISGLIDQVISLENEARECEDKLSNMDSTMEEMETQLLVNEMNKTERGKEVMTLASEVIAGVIGKDALPELLTIEKK